MTIERLLEKAGQYMTADDLSRIEEAYEVAREAHSGQKRESGEPFICHPLAVAYILVELGMDTSTVMAGLLHDVVEDTEVTLEEIEEAFGPTIARLVDSVTKVTKLGRMKYKSKEEQQAENHRKMLVAMAQDVRVILIKLADRLHNMRTLKYQPWEKQQRTASETLEIFSPLAHRLGISAIKWELEDIALRYKSPQEYYRIANLMQKKRAEREEYLNDVIEKVQQRLQDMDIEADISGRPKHIYSIYRKMKLQNKQFNEIYDLLAVRVIVNNIKDCYAVLGIIHTLWKPMPGRFKDYIAMPKANMYQSLHTTVIGPKGEPLEVQIRTWEMHRTAEYGVAAHWAYKEGKQKQEPSFEDKLTWFRQILEWQQDVSDAQEFMESMKMDIFSDVVFVFTPKGDVIELPANSVPLDFAYRIHTEVGNRTIGAKVNGKIVPLDHKLKTGDIVEILTSKHSYGPSRDWLKIAQSSHARSKIRNWYKKERREESVAKGREALEREIKKYGFDVDNVLTEDAVAEVIAKFNFQGEEDMLAAIGYGGITAAQIANRLTEKLRAAEDAAIPPEAKVVPKPHKSVAQGVRVKGVDNLLVRFSKCCNPVPGDDIVGFVTRGRGVSVHRSDCPNIRTDETERLIDVEWEERSNQSFNVDLEVYGMDRRGMMHEVLQVVAESKTNMTAVAGKVTRNNMAVINVSIMVQNLDHLHAVVEKIKQIKDVYSVTRVMQ
ncbi:RelA/SpoT family protein [Numidum massiliense]|uniref:RelA/SpoT family protein n=1 Tax=Numidum massiliense TaxID=1522315 RepID=UPI0006D56E77|nr:bifunctional (p)ppGpp synthetase/guanosine-3',5'-bis(diphosphate) 3'-pyrophosphohydrolase [Numidum massiliense]